MIGSKQLVNQVRFKPECMVNLIHQASICHKSELPPQNSYHWPYEERPYNLFTFWRDPFTRKKFNENSKVIQVEGNISCGKQDFAKRLADELGMKYIPPVDLDRSFTNTYGYDYRALNPLLPERLRLACDWAMYHENPARHAAIHMQTLLFKLRLWQYIKALQHVFNTGQGVVLGRSVFTERVFVEAAHNVGWLPKGYLREDGLRFYDWKYRYIHSRNLALIEMLKPHLTIYLDTPVETCIENAKNHPDPMIRESKTIVPEFFEEIERAYKDIVLPKQLINGHLLAYDYTKRATDDEIMDVIDDIKQLDFEHDWRDTQFQSWDSNNKRLWWFFRRKEYSSIDLLDYFIASQTPYYDIAGMGDCVTTTDLKLRTALYENHVGPFGYFYEKRYDPKVTNVFKVIFGNRVKFGDYIDSEVRCDFP